MKVILLQTVKKIGQVGQVVNVKDGYARNFLIAKKLAMPATAENQKRLDKIKETVKKSNETAFSNAQAKKKIIDDTSVTLSAQVKSEEEIFGSIGQQQILTALKDEGIEIDAKKLMLEEPIKKLGAYNIKVNLHPEVEASLRVWVVKK